MPCARYIARLALGLVASLSELVRSYQSTSGTSGKHFASVLQQLGIAEQVNAKTTLGEAGLIVEPVARGDIEIGIQQITEILPVKCVMLVGPLPAALQKTTTYTISLGSGARDAEAKGFSLS